VGASRNPSDGARETLAMRPAIEIPTGPENPKSSSISPTAESGSANVSAIKIQPSVANEASGSKSSSLPDGNQAVATEIASGLAGPPRD